MNKDFFDKAVFYWDCFGTLNAFLLVTILCWVWMVLIPPKSKS